MVAKTLFILFLLHIVRTALWMEIKCIPVSRSIAGAKLQSQKQTADC